MLFKHSFFPFMQNVFEQQFQAVTCLLLCACDEGPVRRKGCSYELAKEPAFSLNSEVTLTAPRDLSKGAVMDTQGNYRRMSGSPHPVWALRLLASGLQAAPECSQSLQDLPLPGALATCSGPPSSD